MIGAIGLLLPAIAIFLLAPYILRTCAEMIRFFIMRSMELNPTRDRIIFATCINYFVKLTMPILAVAVFAALFSNIAQVGFFWTTKPLAFKPEKLVPNFGAYFSKTLFSVNGLFNLFKAIAKMVIVGATAFILIRADIEKLCNTQTIDLYVSLSLVGGIAIKMIVFTAILLLILSIPDYMFQRSQFRESLKMSRHEVTEERKQEEGDPQIKQRLRQRMRELLSTKIRDEVPKADVVVTNPTHFAVALQYNRSLEGPTVLVKGEDELAQRIKKIARDADVPIVENKPLARALYSEVEIGEVVPVKYWTVIAEILRRVKSIDDYKKMAGV
jgi:flagellar biosynthetic protein FlhB